MTIRKTTKDAAPEYRLKVKPGSAERFGHVVKNRPSPFAMPKYPPGVVPETKLAMDDSYSSGVSQTWDWAQNNQPMYHGQFAEGIGFLGYSYLSQLVQRSEIRLPSEILAEEMTRKFITLKSTSDDDKTDKIKQLEDAIRRFKLREVFRHAIELDGFFGVSYIYPDVLTKGIAAWDDGDELSKPLLIDQSKIGKNSLRQFTVVDPMWVAPNSYNTTNPLDPTFYCPTEYFVNAKRIHASRLLKIVSRPVPDLLKPMYNYGGLALSQLMQPYVDNWLRTRQSVSDLLDSFTIWVLQTDIQSTLQDAGASLDERLAMFAAIKNNRGVMAVDKDQETLANISAPLGSLDALLSMSQEQMAAPARLPLLKLLGYTPKGLNSSTDGEVRTFYDSIHASQEKVLQAPLKAALDIIMLNEWGKIDDEIIFEFDSLWDLDSSGQAAVLKARADTAQIYLTGGVISPDEERQRLSNDPDSDYNGLQGSAPDPVDLMPPLDQAEFESTKSGDDDKDQASKES